MEKDCGNHNQNIEGCNCSYEPCPRKGYCCECVSYHRRMSQLPACFFNKASEAGYDRSFENFIKMLKQERR